MLVVGWWLSNSVGEMCAKALARTHTDRTLSPMLAAVGACAVRVLLVIAALSEVGIATAIPVVGTLNKTLLIAAGLRYVIVCALG
jgi:hypothetical protein